ncbi:Chromosome segregation in meiosis protein 3 [Colletotrichum trifolii]|uniref:Chromosome segregation in meiosis protein 3 n=1 Tax=Colletotrichum trifolii TaxID=5466 RepID=A0A4R8PZ47_COLTR|nr:Chromosome segregation in meiosis protein 3 [Colletotrichum trifolii]
MPPTGANEEDDLENYSFEDAGDLFQSLSPQTAGDAASKRKKAEALGLDEEVEVAKRPRVAQVKLDETRCFSDAARLLSFYQFWLDDLFPKARFLDALAMVEKAGHKKQIILKRNEWINEAKPKPWEDDVRRGDSLELAFLQEDAAAPMRQSTPTHKQLPPLTSVRDINAENDIYSATPLESAAKEVMPPSGETPDQPADDDLDALIAEADAAACVESGVSRLDAVLVTDEYADDEAALAEMDGPW